MSAQIIDGKAIAATIRGEIKAEVDAMHAAWTKAVLLQAILWSRPYTKEGDF